MDKIKLSPYIRVAMHSALIGGFSISERSLFDYEIILVSGGECKITINNTPYICRENDVVFIRPGVLHSFEVVGESDFIQPHIHFDAVYDEKSGERTVSYKPRDKMTESELSLIQADLFADVKIPDVFTPYDIKKFRRVFNEIINIFQDRPYNYELLYRGKMLELFHMMLMQFDNETSYRGGTISASVASVKNYIDNNFLTVITLDSLSKQFYLNKYTMLRKFKAAYKQSVMSYYRNLRIKYAKKLLTTTSLSVYAIAEKLNFQDIYSFSKFFKSYEGLSPTAYRNKHIDGKYYQ